MRNRICLAVFLCLLLEISAGAEPQSGWTKVSPGLGEVQQLIPDRRHPGLWYVVNSGTLYRSEDGGKSWRSTGITNVILDNYGQSKAVSVNPSSSEVLAITNSGYPHPLRLWASTNLGKTFILRSPSVQIERIFSSPQDPNLLFGFSGAGDYDLSISHDGGRHWGEIQSLPYKVGGRFPGYPDSCHNEYYDFADFVISPFDPRILYAVGELYIACYHDETSETVHLASYNGGKTWVPADNHIMEFDVDAATPDFIIGNDYNSLYRLTPRGWSLLAKKDVRDITRVPSNPLHLLGREFSFKHNPAFLRSNDGGKTWGRFPAGLPDTQHLEFDYDGTWLAGTSGAGMYIRKQGAPWVSSNRGFTDANVQDVARASNGTLYILTGESCDASYVFRSSDAGRTWQKIWTGFPPYCSSDADRLFVNDRDPATIAIALGDLYISHDSGTHWRKSSISDKAIVSVAFDPAVKDRVYAIGAWAHRSDDGGVTFQKLPLQFEGNDTKSVHVDPNDNRILYFLVPWQGVFRSSDGGKTMETRNTGLGKYCSDCSYYTPTDLAPLATRDSFLMTTDRGPLYRTMDGGAHWEKIASRTGERIFPADGMGVRFYVFSGYNLYFTSDAGHTWTNLTADLDQKLQRTAITDPRISPWYVATTSGLFTKSLP